MGIFSFLGLPTGTMPTSREVAGALSGVPETTDPNAASNIPVKGANWEANVVRPTGDKSLLIPAWYRGVTLIMQTMGQMVTQYQRYDRLGGHFIEDRFGENGNFNYLLQVRPNPIMTASQMQEQIEYRKIYDGNAYVYIDRGFNAYPKALWLCTAGSYNYMNDTYTITFNTNRGPRVMEGVPSTDVLHYKNTIMTSDYYRGIPTLSYAIKSLSISATLDEQSLQDAAKGGRHKIIAQEKQDYNSPGLRGRMNADELRKTANRFGEDWQANDVVIMDSAIDPKIISQTAKDLQMLESRSFQVSDLARILGVPRIMMMEDSGSSYKMPEHATQEFMLRTIQPRIREMEDELNSKLLSPNDFGSRRIHVCELALRRLDAKGQAEIDKIHLETGWSANEIRAQYDMPAIPDGDEHYVTTNVARVGSDKLSEPKNGKIEKPTKEGGNDE